MAAYSYRDDPAVPPFDDSTPIVVFDGHCVLCSRGVQWMLSRDPDGLTRFAAIQSSIARRLYRHYGLDPDTFDTFMVIDSGLPQTKWRGVLAAARTLPAPWRQLAALGGLVPTRLGDWIYDIVQRNRIGWFGARETCFVPDAKQKRRLLEDAA